MRKTGAVIGLVASIISLIVCCSLFVALMSLDSIADISFGFMSVKYDGADEYAVGEAEIDSEITSLEIEWLTDSVVVEVYQGDRVKISEKTEEELDEEDIMRYRVKNGELSIKPCKPMWLIGINKLPSKALTVLVPEALAAELSRVEISTTSADIDVSGISVRTLDLESVSGNISATSVEADTLDAENVNGTVKISGAATNFNYENVNGTLDFKGSASTIDCEAVNGKINMHLENTPSEIDCEMVNGDMILYLPEDAQFGGKYEMLNGDFVCEFAGKVNKNSFNCGKPAGYEFEAVNGDVEIRINRDE